MFTLFFTDEEVSDYASASGSDRERYAAFFRGLLERGVYVPPSQFEAWFASLVHLEREIEATLDAAKEAFGALRPSS
jgi:glutamate-1-semialdehyde 2,1-aminomutase